MTRERIGGASIKSRFLARLRAADILPLVAAAAIPVIWLHGRYQAHFSIAGRGVVSSDLAIAAVVAAGIVSGVLFGWSPLRRGRVLWILAAAFLGLLLLSCFWRPTELLGSRVTTWFKLLEYALLAPAVVLLFRRAVDFDRFIAVFVAWAFAAGIWGVLMFFAIVDDPEGPRPGQREVSFLGHQDYGAFTGTALAAGFAAVALGTRRWLSVVAIVGGSLGVILDASVFAYAGVLLASSAIALATAGLGTLTVRRTLLIGAVLLAVGGGVLVLRGSDVSNYLGFLGIEKASKSPETGVQTGQQRTMLFWMGLQMWKNHPILGIGLDRSNTDFQPYLAAMKRRFPGQPPLAYPSKVHTWGVQNYWLELAADTGAVGLLLGLATFGAGLVLAYRWLRRNAFAALVAAAFILVVAGTWNAIGIVAGIPMDAVTWVGLGLAAASIPLAAGERSEIDG
jgi:O-Antigen ligase